MKVSDFMYEMRQTSAILGRDSGVQVTFEGDQAYTDGKRVNLPSMSMDADLTIEQVQTMRGYVDHEAGHHKNSNLPMIFDLYDKCAKTNRGVLKDIHNCLEDVWMESKVIEDYRGSYKNLKQVNEAVKTKELDRIKEVNFDLDQVSPEGVCLGIKSGAPAYLQDGSKSKEVNDLLGSKLKEHTDKWVEEALNCKNTEEVIDLAKSVYKLLAEDPELESDPEDFDPKSGQDFDPGDSQDMEGEEGLKTECEGMSDPNGSPDSTTEGQGQPSDQHSNVVSTVAQGIEDEASRGGGGIGGSEGPLTGGYRVYSTEHDRVYDRKCSYNNSDANLVKETDPTDYLRIKDKLKSDVLVMKNKLKRALLARQQRDWDFGRENGRLDTKRLVKAYQGVPTVFKQRVDREEEDTAISILIDLSGSMSGPKMEVAGECAIALAECFEGTGFNYRVTGFRNTRSGACRDDGLSRYHRYHALDTLVYKDYEDTLRQARGAMGNIRNSCNGSNSDYDFVSNEISGLKNRKESRKVLFVLSDGHPATRSDASTDEHMRLINKLVVENKRKGVECVGIGICDSSVSQIYPDNVVVNNVQDLSSTVFQKMTKVLVEGKSL